MIEFVLWMAGGVVVLSGLLVCFVAWLRMLDDDNKMRRDMKHHCHHKWRGRDHFE